MAKNSETMTAIRTYVEEDCAKFFSVHSDIKALKYRVKGENAYLMIATPYGISKFFDVSKLTCEGICKLLCSVMVGGELKREMRDLGAIREISPLFD